MRIFVVIITFCISCAMAAGQAIDWESMRLPDAVRIEAVGYNVAQGTEPFDKIIAEIGPEWVRSEQHLWEGSFGYRMFDFTYDTNETSLIFNFDSKQGRRWDSFRRSSISRVERLVTPMGFVRVARRIEADGVPIRQSAEGDFVVYAFEAPERGLPVVEIVVHPSTREVREVRMPTKVNPAVVRYADWRPLPDGTHHPWSIRFTVEEGGKQLIDRRTEVQKVELLDPLAGPSSYTLPAGAEIVDESRGELVDGSGNTLGIIPAAAANGAADSRVSWNALVVAVGVAMMFLAGLSWQRRRTVSRRAA